MKRFVQIIDYLQKNFNTQNVVLKFSIKGGVIMAKKGKPQLRDLGRFKSGEEIKRRVKKATETGNRRMYSELRLKEKAATEIGSGFY